MDDPWDVKCVRTWGQYTSLMKLNGVPLLPPLLSKECRNEMQYYKLLAKEVEKRISNLKPYVHSEDSEDTYDGSPALISDITSNDTVEEHQNVSPNNCFASQHDNSYGKVTPNKNETINLGQNHNKSPTKSAYDSILNSCETPKSPIIADTFNVTINQPGNNILESSKKSPVAPNVPIELPERDYDYNIKKSRKIEKQQSCQIASHSEAKTDFTDSWDQDGPRSLTAKSFSSSLNDLPSETLKEPDEPSGLARQRSYTLLNPSPHLLAHLEVQSLTTGIEMSCISMSESLSSLGNGGKKRRSWDLETAKQKWSRMALELQDKDRVKRIVNKPMNKSGTSNLFNLCTRARTPNVVKNRRSPYAKALPKSEPVKPIKKPMPLQTIISSSTVVKEPITKEQIQTMEPTSPKHMLKKNASLSPHRAQTPPKSAKPIPVSEIEDPATKVRELYEKLQHQQMQQMANLVEKQKREQAMLQKMFEEQNSVLCKQLKMICPTSSIAAQEAWVDKKEEKGPVSLSQLINYKTPEPSLPTYVDNIVQVDNAIKTGRGLRNGTLSPERNGMRSPSRAAHTGGALRSGHRNTPTSRKLNYESSASSDREYEPILTDRTNDTMADVNVTFSSDSEYSRNSLASVRAPSARRASTDSAIRSMEQTIHNTMKTLTDSSARRDRSVRTTNATPEEIAAATKIVAHAKGYLVRRLMRTERVTSTVQTIKDALLCALQLHQDREGIRGADVDLHRRLIQQITAACYSLHETFVASSPAQRCALLAADRSRRASLAQRPPFRTGKHVDIMSQSHSGAFPARPKRHPASASLMTQSSYETYSTDKVVRARYMPSPRRRPWR